MWKYEIEVLKIVIILTSHNMNDVVTYIDIIYYRSQKIKKIPKLNRKMAFQRDTIIIWFVL